MVTRYRPSVGRNGRQPSFRVVSRRRHPRHIRELLRFPMAGHGQTVSLKHIWLDEDFRRTPNVEPIQIVAIIALGVVVLLIIWGIRQ